jgi:AraC-like DNA-binding protein
VAAIALYKLAADLGYADQSHFARDFKSVVGLTPSGYLQGLR